MMSEVNFKKVLNWLQDLQDKLEKIEEWADDYPAFLSQSTDYARGYKDGIIQAKEIVKSFFE